MTTILAYTIVILLVWVVDGYVPSVDSCCDHKKLSEMSAEGDKGEALSLFECFNASSISNGPSGTASTRVGIVTYTTPSIMSYAASSLSMVTVWGQYNDYRVRHFSPGTGHEFDANDQRWNKVKILHDAFDAQGWGADLDYIAYLDSDLVVLDIHFRLEDVIAQHAHADLIFSKDSQPLNGVMNSGMFIARRSDWTRAFLEQWWGTKETREMATDQHAFSSMYLEGAGSVDVRSHIALLAPHVLNSDFPAWIRQEPHHKVLHLAGCSSLLRAAAFQTGLMNMCGHQTRAIPQYGLDRTYLAKLEREQPLEKQAMALLERMRVAFAVSDGGPAVGTASASEVMDEDVQAFRSELRNLFQRGQGATGDSDEVFDRYPQLVEGLRLIFEVVQAKWDALSGRGVPLPPLDPEWSGLAPGEYINTLETLCSAGFELALRVDGWDGLAVLLDMAMPVEHLVELTREWLPERYKNVLYYPFKHSGFLASLYMAMGNVPAVEDALKEGLRTWREMHLLGFYGYGRGVGYADPYSEGVTMMNRLGSMFCDQQAFLRGLDLLQEAMGLQDLAWGNVALDAIPDEVKQEMAVVAQNFLACASAAGTSTGTLAASARRRSQLLLVGPGSGRLLQDEL